MSFTWLEAGVRLAGMLVGLLCGLFVLAGHISRVWNRRRNLSSVDKLRHQPSPEPNDFDFD